MNVGTIVGGATQNSGKSAGMWATSGTKIIHRLKDGYRLYVVYSPRFVDYFQEGEEISQKVWLVQENQSVWWVLSLYRGHV